MIEKGIKIKQLLEDAQALHRQGNLLAAKAAYEAYLQENADDASAHDSYGVLLAQVGQIEAAKAQFEQALQLGLATVAVFNHLGNSYKQTKDYLQAITFFEKALALDASVAMTWNNLANVYYLQENYRKASENYHKAISLQADYLDALVNLVSCEMVLQAFPSAMQWLEKAYQLNSQHPQVLLFAEKLADLSFITGDNLQAKHWYYRLLNADGYKYAANFNLGVIFMRERNWDSAVAHFHQVLKFNPEDVNALINYATCVYKLGDDSAAINHYQKALAVQPQNEVAAYRLAVLTEQHAPDKAPDEYIRNLFDDYAERFDIDLMERLNYRLPDLIYQACYPYLPAHELITIIDLGCGTGLAARLFAKHARQLIGIDLSEKMLSYAKQKGYYQALICADLLTGLAQITQIADIILAADVFVYLGDLAPIFQSVHEKLSYQGKFVFTVERGFEQDYQLQRTGRYSHTKDYIHQLAQQTGFTLCDEQLISLRKQQENEVLGYLFVLQRESVHT